MVTYGIREDFSSILLNSFESFGIETQCYLRNWVKQKERKERRKKNEKNEKYIAQSNNGIN